MANQKPDHAPDRATGEGKGPFSTLIIQDATMIDGTGSPAVGPVTIVIKNNEINQITENPFEISTDNVEVIDANGMYVMPGFVDTHAHVGGIAQKTPAEYVYKLWMGHGVTTVRDPGSFNGVDWTLYEKNVAKKIK